MLILHQYILKRFFITFFSSIFVFVGIFVIIRLMEQLNTFIRIADQTPFYKYILYFVYEIPFTFNYIIPMAAIFSISFTLGKFRSDSELPILKTAGHSTFYYLAPIVVAIFVYCIVLHLFNDTLIYKPYSKYNKLHREFKKKRDPKLQKSKNITQFGGNYTLYIIKEFNPRRKKLYKGTIISLNKDYSFKKLVTFESASFDPKHNHWIGENVKERSINKSKDFYTVHTAKILDIEEKPKHFSKDNFKKEELSINETKEIALKIKHIGGNTDTWLTEYYFKIATCYVPLIFVLIGIPVSGLSKRSPFVMSFLFCLLFAVVYWVAFEVGRSLGHQKTLPPIVAGWFANIFYVFILAILYQRKF